MYAYLYVYVYVYMYMYMYHQNISQYQLGSVLDQLGFGTETKKRKNERKWNKQK